MAMAMRVDGARKIMVVADPTRESAAALQYALSHALVEQDELILLHVQNQNQTNSWKNTFSSLLRLPSSSEVGQGQSQGQGQGDIDFLDQMKRICEIAQPKTRVSLHKHNVETESSKANALLLKCDLLDVDVIIIGQRRTFSSALLGLGLGGLGSMSLRGPKPIDTAEFLIENSRCVCVGVQRKGQNGGYLLNTKTHKNFWLLA